MKAEEYLLIVAAMGLVTYLPRWLPLVVLNRNPMPEWLSRWLDLIPAAILGALLFPAIFTAGSPRQLALLHPASIAAIPALLIAIKTRSLGLTAIVGMAAYWLLENWSPTWIGIH